MNIGGILVVKDESRWIIPGCVIGQAHYRLVCLPALSNGFSFSDHQGFLESPP